MNLPSHGANPAHLYSSLGIKMPSQILDFSVNTNVFSKDLDVSKDNILKWVQEYPDPEASLVIEALTRKHFLDSTQLLVGNGASQAIYLLAQLFQGQTVGIIQPTFSEYQKACQNFDCEIVTIFSEEENNWQPNFDDFKQLIREVDVVFICHPNNPTGTTYERIEEMIQLAALSEVTIVVDEAFYDFYENDRNSLITKLNHYQNLIILRSLTKMYNLAGIRLGYIAAQPSTIKKLRKRQPTWSVNSLAISLGAHCVNTLDEMVVQTRKKVSSERIRIRKALIDLNYYVSPSVTNFYLIRDLSANRNRELLIYLLENGIVARHTENFPGLGGNYIRFAVKDKSENDRLLTLLKEWKKL
ncbi:threonine-phosphate decarboxylase [Metabacillus herbersteinensis]|uniref:Aminotransferase n=1 Tax=Metabacillus herbersteinensis TaxID=283816 RepID=A0ABV6GDS7_9BACI